MKAKSKLFAAVIALSLPFSTVQSAPASEGDTCRILSEAGVQRTAQTLKVFADDVFGKPAELWQEQDFASLLSHAKICDGKPEGAQQRVSYFSWKLAIENIYAKVLEVTSVAVPISQKYSGVWPAREGVAVCSSIFSFRKDPIWLTNNSKDVFGVAFEAMDATQLDKARAFLDECSPVLEGILVARGKNKEPVAKIMRSVRLSVDRDSRIPLVKIDNLDPELVPIRDGRPVPLAYLSPNTVGIVRRVNTSLMRKIPLQTSDQVLISNWADDVFKLVPEGPDRAYAERVKFAITTQMFPK